MKYIGVMTEKYSYLVEVEAESWEDAQTFLAEANLTMKKPFRIDFEIEKVEKKNA